MGLVRVLEKLAYVVGWPRTANRGTFYGAAEFIVYSLRQSRTTVGRNLTPQVPRTMHTIFAHITEFEFPSLLAAASVGFFAGVIVTWAIMARRFK